MKVPWGVGDVKVEERGLWLIAPVPAHDAECEAETDPDSPCRCEERERDWLRQEIEFERRIDQ